MLPIHERFYTWQGEGVHMGRSAFFIRLYGCPQQCPWCDSAGTWHPDYRPAHLLKMTESDLVKELMQTAAEFAVITGGEPGIFDLRRLTADIHLNARKVHIETSGAFELRGAFDWVTVSPKDKWAKACLPENIAKADEFKLIIETPDDLAYWATVLTRPEYRGQPVWLHPEWSQHDNPAVLCAITEFVKSVGDPYRAGWQLHKNYRADLGDKRSAAAVPLGGDPAKGF